jgi:hypothetical protein
MTVFVKLVEPIKLSIPWSILELGLGLWVKVRVMF